MILEIPGNELLAIALFFVILIIVLVIIMVIFYFITGSTGGLITNLKRNRSPRSLEKDLRRRDRLTKDRP